MLNMVSTGPNRRVGVRRAAAYGGPWGRVLVCLRQRVRSGQNSTGGVGRRGRGGCVGPRNGWGRRLIQPTCPSRPPCPSLDTGLGQEFGNSGHFGLSEGTMCTSMAAAGVAFPMEDVGEAKFVPAIVTTGGDCTTGCQVTQTFGGTFKTGH
jgi:hypothetical protein